MDNRKQTLLGFSFSLLRKKEEEKKQKIVAAEENEKGGVSGGGWSGGQGCLVGWFSVGCVSVRKFQTSWLVEGCLLLLLRLPASLYRSTVCVHTRSNSFNPFATKLGLTVHHHKPEYPLKKVDCCVQGQGHSKGSK